MSFACVIHRMHTSTKYLAERDIDICMYNVLFHEDRPIMCNPCTLLFTGFQAQFDDTHSYSLGIELNFPGLVLVNCDP